MTEPTETSAGEEGGREVMRPARCRCTPTVTELPTISAADQVRRSLRMSAQWARFGRLVVQQLLAEHDAAVERAETAERELDGMRERIGEESVEWAVDGPGGWMQWPLAGAEAFARNLVAQAAERGVEVKLMRRVVGEWREVESGEGEVADGG